VRLSRQRRGRADRKANNTKDGDVKAIVRHEYGSPDVLRLEEVDRSAPTETEVLVRIHAAAVNAGDWHILRGDPFLVRLMGNGILKPKPKGEILGFDIAGTVEAVGSKVTQFHPGDEVFGTCDFGGFAEYACASESTLVRKPANVSFEQAAATCASACTALQASRDQGQLQSGQTVLIHGASGGVGTFAVQLAKSFGAEVTAVCSSRNLDQSRQLGADFVIDYTREDFTKNGKRYDLIIAVNGYRSIGDPSRSLRPEGTCVVVGGSGYQVLQVLFIGPWWSAMSGKKMRFLMAKPNPADLATVKELLEARKIAPSIDKSYPLSEVPDALRYVETNHARGKVVITVEA
jgi:NADPH:quinone reductase-like Zn-dependent oxidoreductase